MSTQTDIPSISLDAAEALEAYRRVLSTGYYADASHRDSVGVTQEKVASGDMVAVRLKSAGTIKMVAAGAITAGAEVFAADDGKIRALPATPGFFVKCGIAINAASGDGSIIEVVPEGWGTVVAAVNQAASAAVTNTTDETAFDKSFTIPANILKAGDIIDVTLCVRATATNSTDTLAVKLKLGSQQIVTTGAVDVANDDIALVRARLVVRTIGASGTIIADGLVGLGASGTVTAKAFHLASFTANTTGTLAITATATWSAASASDSCRLEELAVTLASA